MLETVSATGLICAAVLFVKVGVDVDVDVGVGVDVDVGVGVGVGVGVAAAAACCRLLFASSNRFLRSASFETAAGSVPERG